MAVIKTGGGSSWEECYMEEESIFNKKKPLNAQNIVKYPNTVGTFFRVV